MDFHCSKMFVHPTLSLRFEGMSGVFQSESSEHIPERVSAEGTRVGACRRFLLWWHGLEIFVKKKRCKFCSRN